MVMVEGMLLILKFARQDNAIPGSKKPVPKSKPSKVVHRELEPIANRYLPGASVEADAETKKKQ